MVTAVDPCADLATPRAAASILESISEAFVSVDARWQFTYINAQAEHIFQVPREQLLGKNLWDTFPTALGTPFERTYRRAMHQRIECKVRAPFPRLGAWFDVKVYPLDNGGLGFYFSDVTEAHCAERHVICQKQALELDMSGAPLGAILDVFAESIESMTVQQSRAAFMLADSTGMLRHGAAPSLPGTYRYTVDGTMIDGNAPYCVAAASKRAVAVEHICEHASSEFRDLARSHGLQACWCAPILSAREAALGVLTLYFVQPTLLSAREEQAIAILVRTASLVIDRRPMPLQ